MTINLAVAGRAVAQIALVANSRQPLPALLLALALTGCVHPVGRDVLAYQACAARHPQNVLVCDALRQAYEFDASELEVPAAAMSRTVGSTYAER
jgi:hypothetical protein